MKMTTRCIGSLATLLVVTAAVLLATAPAPRNSPEFTVVEPSGRHVSLSSLQGKVVVVEFLLVNCPHCMRVAQMITKLHKELGPRGFQPIGIAFDNDISGKKVTDYVQRWGITYPIGYSSSQAVDGYLVRDAAERLMVPQIVVIDRAGVIRAQSHQVRESSLEDESYLHQLIDTLLKESATGNNGGRTPRSAKKINVPSETP